MAIQKEIWLETIVEGLFADNSFASKSFNADVFVDKGKTVHIPNAGKASNVEKNRSIFPAQVKTREDIDLTFNLDEFTTDPIRIPNADTAELSYNKRDSVLRQDRAKLIEVASESILQSWLSGVGANVIETTGESVKAHLPSASGNRKALTKNDVKAIMNKFNADNVPQVGRHLLLDAEMYGQLIDSLTENESKAFHGVADVSKGILGNLYGFNIMMRSRVGRYTNTSLKEWSAVGTATDVACAIAWHEHSVCRALGEVDMFANLGQVTYYSDIYSFLVRCGGRAMRNDVAGLLAIKQATA